MAGTSKLYPTHSNIKELINQIKYYKYIYLMLLPGMAFLLVFKYIPIYGIQLAFKQFIINKGLTGGPWVGLQKFQYLWMEPEFWNAFWNTLIVSGMKLLVAFPFPIMLAILINEVRLNIYKRFLQTIYTFPHFLSWVVISGMMIELMNSGGAINGFLSSIGMQKIQFLQNGWIFRWVLVFSSIWASAGWSTILYLASITSIDPFLYEAAIMDGANRWQKMLHITWPGIRSIVVVIFILNVGYIMDAGFMQVFNLYNPAVYKYADIIDTYIYRITFLKAADFSVSTAAGVFKGVTNMIMLLTANAVSKKFNHNGIV